MKTPLTIIFLLALSPVATIAQKMGDNKIIVSLQGTGDVYQAVRLNFMDADFVVKENGNRDTISTYPTDMMSMGGTVKIWAAISGRKVTFFGVYSMKKLDGFGMNYNTDESSRIIYYKGSQSWKTMHQVTEKLGGQISYLKE